MRFANKFFIAIMVFVASVASASVFAGEYSHSTPGISGYHVTVHDGVTYAFTTEEHKKMFEANPQKYLPAYGGYCAYGVAVGKKFVVDPEAWKIVDGTLYLNLDKDIQRKWAKDIPGYIKKAEANWATMKDKKPSDL